MAKPPNKPTTDALDRLIYEIRGQRVMLDSDLAAIYGIPTFRFNEAVKRNRERFPKDFMFRLTREEFTHLISQFAISKPRNSSQIAMSSRKHRGKAYRPYVFTEHGAIMAANVGHSRRRALASYPSCVTAYPHGSRPRVFSTAREPCR
jgi:hypothetical protein